MYLSDPENPEWSWKEGIEMNRLAQSLYQLNAGRVFWDPNKHLRVNGVQPFYKFMYHARCIDSKVPPNQICHVKRPTEQFDKFDVQSFPQSEFTMEKTLDAVMYHSLYEGVRPLGLGMGTIDDPFDLTKEEKIFQPPENQEWFIPYNINNYATVAESMVNLRGSYVVEDPLDPANMMTYLSPTSLLKEQELLDTGLQRSDWVGYNNEPPNLINRWQSCN